MNTVDTKANRLSLMQTQLGRFLIDRRHYVDLREAETDATVIVLYTRIIQNRDAEIAALQKTINDLDNNHAD